jgi:uracil-DNA glycosylase
VDGRAELRRYLEQRREAGERDLVLDDMPVDEVLRILGAAGAAGPSPAADAGPTSPRVAPGVDAAADWRAVLAAAEQGVRVPRSSLASTTPPPPVRETPVTGVRTRDPIAEPRGVGPGSLGLSETTSGPKGSRRGDTSDRWPTGLAVGQVAGELFGGPLTTLTTIEQVAEAVAACTRCPLYATATHPVPGEGSATAPLVCVGEAPGATEDATGRPFVGQAGKLLDKILAAIELRRDEVFICNVLKHRPPGNRNPLPDEVAACSPYLVRQLDIIRPKVVVAFGTYAAQTLLQTKDSIGKLRGAVHRYYGVPLIVTYHPAALLRNPAWKRPTWEDVQYARRILDGTGV